MAVIYRVMKIECRYFEVNKIMELVPKTARTKRIASVKNFFFQKLGFIAFVLGMLLAMSPFILFIIFWQE